MGRGRRGVARASSRIARVKRRNRLSRRLDRRRSSESSGGQGAGQGTVRPEVDAIDPADESSWRVDAVFGEAFDPTKRYRVVTWAGLLDGADDIPVFRDIGERLAAGLADDCDEDDETCEPATVAISGSDGIPFKNLVMRHLCRRRWLEIFTACGSFDALDTDGDGAVSAADVRDALLAHTRTRSPRTRRRRRWSGRSTATATARSARGRGRAHGAFSGRAI